MPKTLAYKIASSIAVRVGCVGLAYFLGAELGHLLSFKSPEQTFATFWPPAGLLLAVLALSNYRSWWAMLLAAWSANLLSNFLHNTPLPVNVGFCVANSLEACVGAMVLRQFVTRPLTLGTPKDVAALVVVSALPATLAGATVGAAIIQAAPSASSYSSVWLTWWVADFIGILVVTPVILTWAAEPNTFLKKIHPWRVAESVFMFGGAILVTEMVYGQWLPRTLRIPIFILPFLLWAGVRFGPRSAATGMLLVALIGVWNASRGRGPFAVEGAELSEQVLRTQGTLGVITLTVLLLAATVAERKRAEQVRIALVSELQKALAEVKTLQGLIPICAWCKKIRDDKQYWHSLEDYISVHTLARFSHGMCPDCLAREMKELTSGTR